MAGTKIALDEQQQQEENKNWVLVVYQNSANQSIEICMCTVYSQLVT